MAWAALAEHGQPVCQRGPSHPNSKHSYQREPCTQTGLPRVALTSEHSGGHRDEEAGRLDLDDR